MGLTVCLSTHDGVHMEVSWLHNHYFCLFTESRRGSQERLLP